ncbi:TIGR02391 family protein [Hymenobacter crusticola]|uniref:TIGR02391 family protein n=1 Tax=Hymenobacter crusticola TaxID=1770526 RepID=A0A243W5Y6_9BACT|nr:TIGR02391 family protein [Hymenobacter crusticola]OUJ69396.1 TIGR02391 family protein [Hymenobacter crusticola]
MHSLREDTIYRDIKQLHLLAMELKSNFDREYKSEDLMTSFKPFDMMLPRILKALPESIKKQESLIRHSRWLGVHLRKGDPGACSQDIKDICFNDIPTLEEAYLSYVLSNQIIKERQPWETIHHVIRSIAQSLFDSGHHANAVEAAFKEINNLVKQAYKKVCNGDKERDGDDLMRKAFSCTRSSQGTLDRGPLLRLTDRDLATDSGYNVQDGYMNLFAGAIRGIRNPKAHENMSIDAAEAWEMLVFASHLMRMWDRGQSVMPTISPVAAGTSSSI